MKITAVKIFELAHPLPRVIGGATAWVRTFEALIVKLETDAGLSGWGETEPLGGVRSLIEDHYAPLLIGRDPMAFRATWRELWGANFGNGMALAAVAIALDDLRGKALGLPVAELYGGRLRDRVPAYAAALYYRQNADPAGHYPQVAEETVARGFRAIKMRIGAQDPKRDLAAVAAVRRAVGPDIRLMADGNGAYTLGTAIRMGRELEQLGLHWFEEPLPQETTEYAAYERLTEKLDIAIGAGEALTSRGMFKEAIARRAMDIVQPDVILAGGIGECLFVAEMARLWGISCVPHCWAGALGIAATVHLISLLPDTSWSRTTESPLLELDTNEDPLRDKLLAAPLEARDGFVSVPRGPGLGVEVEEERLKFYAKRA